MNRRVQAAGRDADVVRHPQPEPIAPAGVDEHDQDLLARSAATHGSRRQQANRVGRRAESSRAQPVGASPYHRPISRALCLVRRRAVAIARGSQDPRWRWQSPLPATVTRRWHCSTKSPERFPPTGPACPISSPTRWFSGAVGRWSALTCQRMVGGAVDRVGDVGGQTPTERQMLLTVYQEVVKRHQAITDFRAKLLGAQLGAGVDWAPGDRAPAVHLRAVSKG
jgi:hypothetical protein